MQITWIRPQQGRVAEQEIARFVKRHPEESQLSRVDEACFNGLLFPAFNSAKIGDQISRLAQRGALLGQNGQVEKAPW